MAKDKAKATKRKTRGSKPNYVIIGNEGQVLVVSGATGGVSLLDKARATDVVALIRERQRLGKKLAKALTREGLVGADEIVIDLEAGA